MSIVAEAAAARKRANDERNLGHYEEAIRVLQHTVEDLQGAIETCPAEERKAIAANLADFMGMLGGLHKRQNDLDAALRAYDTGFRYESDPQFQIKSSYNALNRLVLRLLMSPQSLTTGTIPVDVEDQLRNLRASLQASLNGPRKDDCWAAGDLAIVCGLLRDDMGAEAAVRHFESLSPPPYAYAAYQETLASLSEAVSDRKHSLNILQQRLTQT
jgi:tetratricopeptide (TPR) repeat protein